MFLELGGFDDLYRPGCYEDFDLSFRAWPRGWKAVARIFPKETSPVVPENDSGERGAPNGLRPDLT